MADSNGLSLGDVAALSNGGFGGLGGDLSGLIYLAVIFAMFGGGFGFGGFGNGASAAVATGMATQADMQRGFDQQNTMAQTRDILGAVTSGTAQTIAASTANATNAIEAIKDGNANIIREFGTVETALTALSGNMQNCCCEVKQAVMQSNYDAAMRDAATNANLTSQIQSVKDQISQNKIEQLQAQINQLTLQNAMSGVLKFPSAWAYNGGSFPPITTTAGA